VDESRSGDIESLEPFIKEIVEKQDIEIESQGFVIFDKDIDYIEFIRNEVKNKNFITEDHFKIILFQVKELNLFVIINSNGIENGFVLKNEDEINNFFTNKDFYVFNNGTFEKVSDAIDTSEILNITPLDYDVYMRLLTRTRKEND